MTISERDSVPSGIVYMLLGILLLSTMDAAVKWVVVRGISPVQILALRSLIIIPAMLLAYSFSKQMEQLKPTRIYWHTFRGIIGFVAPAGFFLALRYLPLSDAVVVFFSATFLTTILSVVVLKEHVGWHRWAAVVVGYVGVVIAIAPKGEGQLLGYLLVMVSSVAYAFLFVSGRFLSATESVVSLVFSFNVGVGLFALILLPFFWLEIGWSEAAVVLLIAGLAFFGHLFLTTAFARAPVSAIAPFEYSALLWAVGFDYFIWQQTPSAATWVGACLIVGSGLYVLHREQLHEEQKPVTSI